MTFQGDTIFITGGGSGIGRGLAEALHARGNKVIIAGRRRERLAAVLAANPGMAAIELDITNPASVDRAAAQLIAEHPDLNVLINNAGVMEIDAAEAPLDDAQAQRVIDTNLLGPLRMTSALIEHLKMRDHAAVAYVSSVLGFTPLAFSAVYSATKAAIHSYALSQRFQLRDTKVRVLEIAPPWVRTELLNSSEAEEAMPLDQFIGETLALLDSGADELVVAAGKPLRDNVGPNEHALVQALNTHMTALFAGHAA